LDPRWTRTVAVGFSVTASDTDTDKLHLEILRGEQTAAAMESKLTNLEQRIDELLASVEEKNGKVQPEQHGANGTGSDGASKGKSN